MSGPSVTKQPKKSELPKIDKEAINTACHEAVASLDGKTLNAGELNEAQLQKVCVDLATEKHRWLGEGVTQALREQALVKNDTFREKVAIGALTAATGECMSHGTQVCEALKVVLPEKPKAKE